jgi:hypothetical protein
MKFFAMTIACIVIGGAVGACIGTLHDRLGTVADQVYIHSSKISSWR